MKIAERLASLVVPIGTVSEDPENVRIHPVRNLDAIHRSLERFGQRKPIVVRNGIVVAGNGTLRAALELGATEIAVIDADDLTEAEAKAYGIMDNKSSDLGEWDMQKLGDVLRGMDEALHEMTGFDKFEIEPLLQAIWDPSRMAGGGSGKSKEKGGDALLDLLSPEQKAIIFAAINLYRETVGDRTISIGECMRGICQVYLDASVVDDVTAASADA